MWGVGRVPGTQFSTARSPLNTHPHHSLRPHSLRPHSPRPYSLLFPRRPHSLLFPRHPPTPHSSRGAATTALGVIESDADHLSPRWATSPPWRSRTRSHRASTAAKSWLTKSMVVPA